MFKKILTFLYLILLIVALYFFQVFVIDNRDLFGVKPNLILILVIVVSLWYGIYKGTIFAFIIGFITDIIFGNTSGMFLISYTLTGAITGLINYNYRRENKISLVYVTLISTAIFEVIQYMEYLFLTHTYSSILYFIRQIILASILNTIIVFIIYRLIYKVVEYFEASLRKEHSL